MQKSRIPNLYLSLVFIASLLLAFAGFAGLFFNDSKLENLKQNEILLELKKKVSSGQLEVDEGLGIILVQAIEDAHTDAARFTNNIYIFGICVGLFLLLITAIYVVFSRKKAV